MKGQLQELLNKELLRQQNSLELIASENYVSQWVLSAYSNVFTNKYSEWYPGKRYYGGNEVVDELELYTQDLALQIFWLDKNKWWVNVQALSGSVANLAVYTGVLEAGDTVLAMDLASGGHLTHGMKLNTSAKFFNFIHYGVDEKGIIDYNNLKELALEHKPKLILAGFSSYPRSLEWYKFVECKKLLEEQGHHCYLMADIAHIAGLIAGKVLLSPFEAGFDIITTTTHKTLRGPRGALIYFNTQNNATIEKDINRGVFPGVQGGPFDHVLVAKSRAFEEILDPEVKRNQYCSQIISNTKVFADELQNLGWELATGGTENHLLVLDVTKNNGKATEHTGKTAEKALEEIWLSTNKQLIPHDPRSPMDPSGLRIGTPAITSRGLIEEDMKELAMIINKCLTSQENHNLLSSQVLQLCKKYPLWY
jgi:glycine hydroxymethyltransferase